MIMNRIVFVIVFGLSVLFFSTEAYAETKDDIEISISVTDDHPDVYQVFELRVTITNHKTSSITSENDWIITVLSQTNDTNIEFKSSPNSTLDPNDPRTEVWEVSFNLSGIKAFDFVFENEFGSDTNFDVLYNIEIGYTDAEPGDRPEDNPFDGPTNTTTSDFITRIGGTGAVAAIFGIAFVLFGYLIISRISSQKET